MPTPKKSPLIRTKYKVIGVIVTLIAIACFIAVRRVTKAAFAPVQFELIEAILARRGQNRF